MPISTVAVGSAVGLHARPAMSLVDTATGFSSDIKIAKGAQAVDAKSIMQLMMLAATKGTELVVTADGPDAEAAVAAISALVESKFDEE